MKVMTSRIPQFIGAGLVGLGLSFGLSGAVQADHHGMKADIVDTAVEAGQFETLVAAVKAANLVETLKGEGPFTVFAPTDEAFAALPEGTVDDLLKPENRDTLTAVLTYHVVPGKVMAEDAMAADSATTVQGQDISITTMDGQVMVNDATVIQPDIEASNGVIHVIDGVLMPE
ncbi:fasciclin domain-containing protein [Halomonas smyrnensis]|uniref:fasciclin domain-containing protein n=1 Tax=Halomonas smyrnensis TaxID=720605 RepID=UPI0002E00E08|nr:fasciclin domain-containing protein [Halomonas smyrnensis]